MKKRALRKNFYMEIRKSLGRFLSIFFIVAMGVAFFSGIRSAEPDMRYSADAYFDRNDFMDIQIMGTLGITEEDVTAIEQVEGVEKAEPGYSADMLVDVHGNQKILHVSSVLDSMNDYKAEEGRMPEKSGECLMDQDFAASAGLKVGDSITLLSGTRDPLTDTLQTDTYEITGLGSSVSYISFERGSSNIGNGEVSGFLTILPEDFSLEVYTECYVTAEGAKELTAFTPEYDKKVETVLKNIEDIGDYQGKLRADSIREEAGEELKKAEQELADGKARAEQELSDAWKQIGDGEQALADGKTELAAGKQELEEGRNQLYSSQKQVDGAYAQIQAEEQKLNQGKQELQTQEELLQQKEQEYEEALAKVESGEAEIFRFDTGYASLEAGIRQIEQGIAQGMQALEAARGEYEQGVAVLEAARGQVAAMEEQLKQEGLSEEEKQALISQIEIAKTQISQQEQVLAQAKATLEEQEKQFLQQQKPQAEAQLAALKEQKAQLDAQKPEIEESRKALEAARGQLEEQKPQLDKAKVQLQEAKNQIAAGEAQLAETKQQAAKGQQQIDSGWSKIHAGEQELKNGEAEIAENEKKLEDARKAYEEGKAEAEQEIQDGENEIKDAKQKIEDIEDAKWYVNDRSITTDYAGYGDNADRMRAIGEVFPILFFIVAALISLTTMTRMVEEQRTEIGTLKALGYGKMSIAGKYLNYAMTATIGGSIFGVLFGEKIFPYIIITAYKIMYTHVPDVVIPYNMKYGIWATVAAVLCTGLATLLACYKELAAQPAVLMRPPAPKQGKRVFLEYLPFLWKRLGFIWKSTIRNLIRYKKRFFMTVFGIGGCMALMIVGFGLRDSIFSIGTLQYEELQLYDGMIILNTDADEEDRKDLETYLEEEKEISAVSKGYLKKTNVKKGNEKKEVYLYAPLDLEKNKDFLVYRDRRTHETYELGEKDAILTEKAAKALGIKKGDKLSVESQDGEFTEITITNICENYMEHYLYLSPELYEEIYGKPVEENNIYFKMKDLDEKKLGAIGENILEKRAALNVSYTYNMEERLDEMLESLDIVIVVLIISAGLLAFVVLYNLNNINITERKRELATIKVLGFYDNEVSAYVYRENILLTLIGTVAGVLLGSLLHRYVITTVEIDSVMFTRIIENISFVYSALLTFGFSVFVNVVMYFKLKKIDMVESLKSVE
ncbi:ABC transporter permease [Blautia sp.]|uniref:ABC transporter permease n=1 Tax=Blautia sp. TaxID=1955243 RepID=UPI002E77A45D|nr:FtsX-like permease family protein [Blautia sp.]MEE0811832.1 FtsX-like permease family protein [Blautia sp.]